MNANLVAVAQRGIEYSSVVAKAKNLRDSSAADVDDNRKRSTVKRRMRAGFARRGGAVAFVDGGRKRTAAKPAVAKPAAKSSAVLTGPFLSPGSLSNAERLRLIDGVERVLEGVFTHLPLKRARYGFDPVQRLRILRTQLDQLADDSFHIELADIITRLRDAHTRYTGPSTLSDKVAALPFLVEMIGSNTAPRYVVTKVGTGLDPNFKPGVLIEYWNGVPIDRAVMRHSDREVGGRPDSQRACAILSLTLRSLQFGPPPDEHWVIVGYRATTSTGTPTGAINEVKIPWRIVDPSQIESLQSSEPIGKKAKLKQERRRAINPAAAAIRQAKMLLFAPHALTGEQPPAGASSQAATRRQPAAAGDIKTKLTDTLRVKSINADGGPFGYLRIWGFDTEPEGFIEELRRLIPLLPDNGLIIDVRGNPGGYILAAELALQLFTPNRIEPTRFSVLATPFTREMARVKSFEEDLKPWKDSLEAAVRNGELYSQPLPITNPTECNEHGQEYGGPVVLVGDSTTYSAGDLFSAGFVDNKIGPFLCVGEATGAGGANVWDYTDIQPYLVKSRFPIPKLPDGIGMSFSFRRATRSGSSEGLPIEDIGIAGTPYAMTFDDLLSENRDLIAHCIGILRQQKLTRLVPVVDRQQRTIAVTTTGLDCLDLFTDGHSGGSFVVQQDGVTTINYPAGCGIVELVGFDGKVIRQRRRIEIKP